MKKWNYMASGFCLCGAFVMALCHKPSYLVAMLAWGLFNFFVAEGLK